MGTEAGDDDELDVVADRHSLIVIGMAAVWVACVVFATMRLAVTLGTGMPTPWWGNATGAVAMTALYAWYRRRRDARSSWAVHGTALVATLALLVPIAYGMSSTIWWLSLVGFATVLLGRHHEAKVWGVAIPLLVVAAVLAEPHVRIEGAPGEPFVESALAKIVFVFLLVGMAAAFRRVAEQRAIALHDSEERYRMLFQSVPVGVLHYDRQLRITDCNPRLGLILGRDRESLIGYDLGSLPDQRLLPALRGALAGEPRAYDGPFDATAADGDVAVSVRTVPLGGAAPTILGALGMVEDVSDRVRMEAALRRAHDDLEHRVHERTEELQRSTRALAESEERYRLLFERNLSGVFRWSADGRVLDCNDACVRVFGYDSQAEMLATPVSRLFGTPLEASLFFERLRHEGQLLDHEGSYRRKDGKTIHVLENVSRSDDILEGILFDVSDRKLAEAERERHLRTEQEARRQAEEALRARDEFIQLVAHELRTPLTSMRLAVQTLRSPATLSAPAVEAAHAMVERQTRRLVDLVEWLLDVARMQAGRIELEREPCDLSSLVREVLSRFDVDLARAGSTVALQAVAPVNGSWDRSRVDQVVTILLSNAIKYGRGRPIEIVADQDDHHARLTVRDHGDGIPQDRLDSIFGRFERAVSAMHYGGLGLGLYFARRIVELHGGTIEVASVAGEGASFTVRLPLG